MQRLTVAFLAGLAAATLIAPRAGAAAVLYSTLGPGDSFSKGTALVAFDYESYVGTVLAPFTAATSATVTEIDLALLNPEPNAVGWSRSVFLLSDNDGTPASVLASWTDISVPSQWAAGFPQSLTALTGDIPVIQGRTYWIQVQVTGDDALLFWAWNDQSYVGSVGGYDNLGVFFSNNITLPAYQVLGETVPEPASLMLGLAGIAGLLALRRRRP